MGGEVKKIAILGAGVGGMATAFALTNREGFAAEHEVTVYQMGFRVGGKGASGRNAAHQQRIEEHGLHIWLGFYDNAFRVIRQAYAEMEKAPDNPFRTWEDAFKKHSLILLEEKVGSAWKSWPIDFPEDSRLPGDPGEPAPTIWSYVEKLVAWMDKHVSASHLGAPSEVPARVTERPFLARALSELGADVDAIAKTFEAASMEVGRDALAGAVHLAGALADDPAQHDPAHRGLLLDLLDEFFAWLKKKLEGEIASSDIARRLFIALELGYLHTYGMLKDGVLENGFTTIEGFDYVEWLRSHGGSELALTSAPIRGFYDLVFAYEDGDVARPNFSAAVAVQAALHVVFDYKGAIFWRMQAGMGDTVFTPLYSVLRKRGVKFEFFHKVENLGLSADARSIETVRIGRQVALAGASYDPLVTVGGLPCWPSAPLYDQIEPKMAAELRERSVDLESYSNGWQNAEERTLVRGTDFDAVVLAIPPGAISRLCPELIAASAAWRDMVANVGTVATQAMQLWLEPSLAELGWTLPSPVMDAYVEPQNTWADMSHLLVREAWGGAQRTPKNVAYFCGPLDDVAGETPGRSLARVAETSTAWLRDNVAFLWPSFDFAKIIESFFRANVEPSERYVLSKKGTARFRLPPGGSGFDNLYLAGDWTDSGFNAGCVEAAVISGLLAAKAITGWDIAIVPR